MSDHQFRRQPTFGKTARRISQPREGYVPPEVDFFKSTYVMERRVLERFRLGDIAPYRPSAKLDGKSMFDTPEEKPKENAWVKAYDKLRRSQTLEPSQYLRILFRALRGSSYSIPTVEQVAATNWLHLAHDHFVFRKSEIQHQYLAESQRAHSAIVLQHKGGGHALSLAVYYAIVDDRLELSPLFRYCLAMSTSKRIREGDKTDLYCDRLEKLAKRYEFLAAMDYTLFPDVYDTVLEQVLPLGFRVAAFALLEAARGQ